MLQKQRHNKIKTDNSTAGNNLILIEFQQLPANFTFITFPIKKELADTDNLYCHACKFITCGR